MAREEANSGTATGSDYDVFLSFRGPDTRNTFADILYVLMKNRGIRVFRDDEELRPGEKISEILRAVENSQIYIPIFSKNYASSRWCLRELKCMVKSHGRSPGKQILPIFYDVEPGDVKLETEVYRSALTKHEEDPGCTEVKQWKEALTTVARIKGWHIKDKRQGELIDDVIKKVSQMIIISKRDLPTYLVGIDDRIEDIKKLLNHGDTGDVRFVIIHGMGGIGKTTLAKAIFNELFSGFEGHSFLSNILESSPCRGIVKMQRKLVSDLFNFSLPETFDFEDVNNMIRNRLPHKQVLLVFDGMDENDQFMQLAKHCTSCGPGSRIIITTRDKCVFPKIKVEGLEENILTRYRKFFLYEMKEMHFDHALQLFKKLAINTDSALFDLYDLSREAVALTGGLPLAIEVIGSHLRTISKAKWKSTLKKLKEIPHEEVQRKLKISYDALGHETKQIFLDIACFFVNKKITDAMYMWEACDLFPEVEIDVLTNKSLIKIVDRDRIWIHDQLRDLGREIVRQESIGKPGDRSRLWFLEMALNIVLAKKGTENVVALTLWRLRHNFTREDFANLINVRFLELDGGNFTGNFEDILPELRWLCWRNCPPKLQANNFVLNHLVVLKLSGNIIIEEWSGWVEMMVPSKLKVLHLMESKSLIKTPPFHELISLERLVLKDFPKLAEIDPSVGKLERLIYLKIKWCPHLRGLPKEIGCLTALRELILVHCFSVYCLPESICYLEHLSRLVMEDTRLVVFPVAIKKLVALEYMSLVNCTSLDGLPDAVGKLGWLTELDLSGTAIEELPYSIRNREDLTVQMNSSNIKTPRRLEDEEVCIPREIMLSYDALKYEAKQIFLDIACFFVDKKITNAMYMWKACEFFPEIEIDVLIHESLIIMVDHDRIRMDDELRDFGRKIVRQESQESTDKSGDRSRLCFFDMALDIVRDKKGTENVVALTMCKSRHNFTREDFANLKNVRFLELDGGNFAGNFEDILPQLKWLCWRNCPPKLQANNFMLNHLVVLKLLGHITTEGWSGWVKIMAASKLKVLKLAESKSLIKTPCFSEFMSLERLILKDFPSLAEIDHSIGKLERLIYLKIKWCPRLRELPKEIGCLTNLRELILIQGCSICYLPDSIGNLRRLSRLIMEDTGLVKLPDTIKGLVDLEHLCLANCGSLNSLSDAVGELKSLTHLDLSGTTIEELPSSLWNLEVLTLLINNSKLKTQLMRYLPFIEDLERLLDLGRSLGPDGPFESAILFPSLLGYPMEIFAPEGRTIAASRFHEHPLSGRCLPKISVTISLYQIDVSSMNVSVKVPLWDTGFMSSSQPLLYLKSLILMLVPCLVRTCASKWMHHSRREVALLSLEFCNHCMCITSENVGFSPILSHLEGFDGQIFLSLLMTLYEPGHSHQIGVKNLAFINNLSHLNLGSIPLQLPCSREQLLGFISDYIEMRNSWHEEATQVQHLVSRRSFENGMSQRQRNSHGYISRATRKLNLSWLCFCRNT